MGYIKEPEGVDFIINGKPLTDKQKQAISDFIKADKAKRLSVKKRSTKLRKSSKQPAWQWHEPLTWVLRYGG